MRELKILQTLEKRDSYVKIQEISNTLKVTTRTIMKDMKYLCEIGRLHGFEVELKRGQGYYLKIHNEKKYETFCQKLDQGQDYNKENRQEIILSILLLEGSYLSQDFIAELLNVSKAAIKSDIEKIEDKLHEHKIVLERKAHHGIRLNITFQHRKDLIQLLYEQDNTYMVEKIDACATEHFKDIEKLMISLLKAHHLSTNYNELKKIDVFLKVMIYCHLNMKEEPPEIKIINDNYAQLATELLQHVEKQYNIRFNKFDISEFAKYVKGKTKKNQTENLYHKDLKNMIEEFLIQADQEYDTKFNEDEQFKVSLLAHVSLLLDRLHQSISFTNPLMNEISAKYPAVFNLAIKFSNELQRVFHVEVTQEETGFIATHFAAHMEKEVRDKMGRFNKIAVLCSSGGGSAYLIKLKLESLFTSSNIQTFSLLDQDEVKTFQPDIIFTIMDLVDEYDVPIIRINELLDDNDILKIKNMFSLSGSSEFCSNEDVIRSFSKDFFKIYDEDIEYLDLLKKMSLEIEESGRSGNTLSTSVIERENFLSTVYQNGIAIAHPMEMCGIQNTINVAILKSPITSSQKTINIIFLVSLIKPSLSLHQLLTRILFDIMSDEKNVMQLKDVQSFEEFMLKFKEFI